MSPTSPLVSQNAASRRWLSIVGIGEDGVDGLEPGGAQARSRSPRSCSAASAIWSWPAPLIRGAVRPWPSPFDRAVAEVLAQRGRQVCVLASGDPFLYGVGPLLARHVDAAARWWWCRRRPPFSLAAARLGWPLPETTLLSLHGRPLDLVRPHLHPGARILVADLRRRRTRGIARLLRRSGLRPIAPDGAGGARRAARAHPHRARGRLRARRDRPAQCRGDSRSRPSRARAILARAAGLADALFEHDGQITKREIRAVTLSSLAPRRGETALGRRRRLGLGRDRMDAGRSIAARRRHRTARRSRRAHRAQCRRRSACPSLESSRARRRRRSRVLPTPDAVFVGGGGSDAGLARCGVGGTCAPGGRLVVNAVTLETEAMLIARHATARRRTDPHRVSRAAPVGGMTRLAPGHAGDAVDLDEAMIVAGIGCRAGASVRAIEAALAAALEQARPRPRCARHDCDVEGQTSLASRRPPRRAARG